jgi:hypothetical protein
VHFVKIRLVLPRVHEASRVSSVGRRESAVGGACDTPEVTFSDHVSVQDARSECDVAQRTRKGYATVWFFQSGGYARRHEASSAVAGRRGRGARDGAVRGSAAIVASARRAAREGQQMGARRGAGVQPSRRGRGRGNARSGHPAAARASLRQSPRDAKRATDSASTAEEVEGAADEPSPRLQP